MKFIKENKQILALAAMVVVFFFIYSYLSFSSPLIFNSPDETANFYFAKLFAEEGKMWQTEPLEFLTGNSIFPRSMRVVGGRIVPAGFIGMPVVFGAIAKITGIWSIKFLTPFFAVLAVLAFYGIIRRIFEEKIAFFSAILMFALPPFWYYVERGMFHNVLFLSFFIFSVYFLLSAGKRWIFWILGGLFLSLALMTRMSEAWWIMLVLAALAFAFRKNIFWRGVFMALTVFILVLIPFLAQNQILYGSPFATGYQPQVQENQSPIQAMENYLSAKTDSKFIFPFGINSKNILWSGWNYYIMFFPWLTVPAFLGIILFLFKKNKTRNEILYFFSFFLVTVWLIVYYGSWKFNDNIDPNKITIGTSYLRYWLPSFVMLLPFLSKLILYFTNLLKFKIWKMAVNVLMSGSFIFLSFFSVFCGADEGIFQVKQTLYEYDMRAKAVFELTEHNSIIITDRSDKLFFPARRIIYPLRDDKTYNLLPKLVDFVPVYYYSVSLPEKDINYLNEEKLNGVKIEEVKNWENNEALYKFQK